MSGLIPKRDDERPLEPARQMRLEEDRMVSEGGPDVGPKAAARHRRDAHVGGRDLAPPLGRER